VANELWGYFDQASIDKKVAEHGALRSEDVAGAVIFSRRDLPAPL
jgi:hypothetical protein